MNSYVSLDLETTGLNFKLDKIIEVGAVKVIDGEIADKFSSFVNPGRKLEEKVIALTGITQEDVDKAPLAKDVIPELIEFIGDLPLLGHRIIFDYSFVKHEAVNLKIPFEKEAADTLRIARVCLPELPSKKLTSMCEHYNIKLKAHRAFNDAEATAILYECLNKDYNDKYKELFEPAPLVVKVKKESPARKSQIEKINELIERHGIDCPYDLSMMTKNEASRYYDKIIAEYGK